VWPCGMVVFGDKSATLVSEGKDPLGFLVVSLLSKRPWTLVRFAKADVSPAWCLSCLEPFLLPSWSLTPPFPGTAGGLRAQPGRDGVVPPASDGGAPETPPAGAGAAAAGEGAAPGRGGGSDSSR